MRTTKRARKIRGVTREATVDTTRPPPSVRRPESLLGQAGPEEWKVRRSEQSPLSHRKHRSSEWLTFIIQGQSQRAQILEPEPRRVSATGPLPQGTAECKAFFDTAASILKRKGSGPGSGENKASERRATPAGSDRPLFPQPEPARPTAAARAGGAGRERGEGCAPRGRASARGRGRPRGRARAGGNAERSRRTGEQGRDWGRGRRAGSGRGRGAAPRGRARRGAGPAGPRGV